MYAMLHTLYTHVFNIFLVFYTFSTHLITQYWTPKALPENPPQILDVNITARALYATTYLSHYYLNACSCILQLSSSKCNTARMLVRAAVMNR